MNEESAVIRRKTEETLDYFVNMDNKYLTNRINRYVGIHFIQKRLAIRKL